MGKVLKRFIAGAVCPRCGEMDRLVTYSSDDGTFKECVACHFEEKQAIQLEVNELGTRVNHLSESEMSDDNSDVQVVQLMGLAKKKVP